MVKILSSFPRKTAQPRLVGTIPLTLTSTTSFFIRLVGWLPSIMGRQDKKLK
jgi:hypothetical protein